MRRSPQSWLVVDCPDCDGGPQIVGYLPKGNPDEAARRVGGSVQAYCRTRRQAIAALHRYEARRP